MGTNIEFKTMKELDDEDWERFKKKQDDIFARKKAKFESEGHKCVIEGCSMKFKDYQQCQDHITKHQEELKKRMICNQPKCGKKFNNRRSYNAHCEEHKAVMKARVVSSIRAILMYNKHGLLLEVFEQEYRKMVGKPIPYKLFGYNCIYDLLLAWSEVVEITQLGGGQTLLIGVPDKNTEHIAKMVRNQRDNIDGFNWKNGQMMSRVSIDEIRKIERISDRKLRAVPEFMKKQVEQLVEMEFFEEGLLLTEFQQVYEHEFGYAIDYKSYGFFSLQDFCYNGLQGSARVDLTGDGWWKLFPLHKFQRDIIVDEKTIDIPEEVKANVKTLLQKNPFGLSYSSFLRIYENHFCQLFPRQYRCSDLYEMLLLLPDCCVITTDIGGEIMIVPHFVVGKNASSTLPLNILVYAEVKNNIHHELKSHKDGVNLDSFVKGYEGFYGCLPLALLGFKTSLELLKALGDVCEVKDDVTGHLVFPVGLQTDSDRLRSIGAYELCDVVKVLETHAEAMKIERFPEIFLETYGENLPSKLCYSNMITMFRELNDEVQILEEDGQYPMVKLKKNWKDVGKNHDLVLQRRKVYSGWVNVLPNSNCKIMNLQMTDMIEEVKEMESRMDLFYTAQMKEENNVLHLTKGQLVAALYFDLMWHRGVVVEVKNKAKMVVVEFVDWGWRADVAWNAVKILDKRFGLLPSQTLRVRLNKNMNSNWTEVIKEKNMFGWVGANEEGSVCVDLYARYWVRAEEVRTGMITYKTSLKETKSSGLAQQRIMEETVYG